MAADEPPTKLPLRRPPVRNPSCCRRGALPTTSLVDSAAVFRRASRLCRRSPPPHHVPPWRTPPPPHVDRKPPRFGSTPFSRSGWHGDHCPFHGANLLDRIAVGRARSQAAFARPKATRSSQAEGYGSPGFADAPLSDQDEDNHDKGVWRRPLPRPDVAAVGRTASDAADLEDQTRAGQTPSLAPRQPGPPKLGDTSARVFRMLLSPTRTRTTATRDYGDDHCRGRGGRGKNGL